MINGGESRQEGEENVEEIWKLERMWERDLMINSGESRKIEGVNVEGEYVEEMRKLKGCERDIWW